MKPARPQPPRIEHGTRKAKPVPALRKPVQVPPAWLIQLLNRRTR